MEDKVSYNSNNSSNNSGNPTSRHNAESTVDSSSLKTRSRTTSGSLLSRGGRNNPYGSALVAPVELLPSRGNNSEMNEVSFHPNSHLTANPEDTTEIVSLFATFDPDAVSGGGGGGGGHHHHHHHQGVDSAQTQPSPLHPYFTGGGASSSPPAHPQRPESSSAPRTHNPYTGAQVVPPSTFHDGIAAPADRSCSGPLFSYESLPYTHSSSSGTGGGMGGGMGGLLSRNFGGNSNSTSQNPLMFHFNASSAGGEGTPFGGEPRGGALASSQGNVCVAVPSAQTPTALGASQGDVRIVTTGIHEDGNITVSVKQKVRGGVSSLGSSFAVSLSQTDPKAVPMPPSPSPMASTRAQPAPQQQPLYSEELLCPSTGDYKRGGVAVGGDSAASPQYGFTDHASHKSSAPSTPSIGPSRRGSQAPVPPQPLVQPQHPYPYHTPQPFQRQLQLQQQQPAPHLDGEPPRSRSNSMSPPCTPRHGAGSNSPRNSQEQQQQQPLLPRRSRERTGHRPSASSTPSSRSPRRTPGQSPARSPRGGGGGSSYGRRSPRGSSLGRRSTDNSKGRTSPRNAGKGGGKKAKGTLGDAWEEMVRADRRRPITGFVNVKCKVEGFRCATSLNMEKELPVGTKVVVEGDRGNLIGEVLEHLPLSQMIEDCEELEDVQPQIAKNLLLHVEEDPKSSWRSTITAAVAVHAGLCRSFGSFSSLDDADYSVSSAPPPPCAGSLQQNETQVYKPASAEREANPSDNSACRNSVGSHFTEEGDTALCHPLKKALSPAEQQEKLRSVVFAYKEWPWVVRVASKDDLEGLEELREAEVKAFQAATKIVRHYVHRGHGQREEKASGAREDTKAEGETESNTSNSDARKPPPPPKKEKEGRRRDEWDSDDEDDLPSEDTAGEDDPNAVRLVSVEYQLNRQKLTLYVCRPSPDVFVDFRRMQRKLFRTFRCRIWMVYTDEIADDNDSPAHVRSMVEVQRQKQLQQQAMRKAREQKAELEAKSSLADDGVAPEESV